MFASLLCRSRQPSLNFCRLAMATFSARFRLIEPKGMDVVNATPYRPFAMPGRPKFDMEAEGR